METEKTGAGTVEKAADLGLTPSAVHKRWMLELSLSEQAEKDWKEDAKKAVSIYDGSEKKAHSFNILWANTETLRPALYNSLPQPDIRKRFDDPDAAGREAAEILERGISYSLDCYGADSVFKLNTLDVILPGRAVARVRYVPSIAQEEAGETAEGEVYEELAGEQVVVEHVHWCDFRHGPGKTWGEVNWIAFRHQMTREQLEEKFPEVAAQVPLSGVANESVEKADAEVASLFKSAEVWEIWDKDAKKVVFVATNYRNGPLAEIDDPLSLVGFYPIAEPVRAIESADSLVPITLYSQYEEQAKELNVISARINKLTQVLKYRGVYDAALTEIDRAAKAGDNEFLPIDNSALWSERGFDKGIWMMPIEQAAQVLVILQGRLEACKQTIYELTGISDIVRGASNAQETATAQEIKAQFGTIRLQRLQQEMQRFIRDTIRLMAEVMAEKFQPQTLLAMTGKKIPTQAEVQQQMMQAQMQWQQMAMQAQQFGQAPPPPPQPPQVVTLEQVMEVLRSDLLRQYRIDIETNSTIQALESANQKAIGELLTGIGQMAQAVIPAVQAGMLPGEAASEIVKAVVRKFKLGRAVEDALDAKQEGPSQQVQQAMQQVQEAQQQVEQKAQEVGQEAQRIEVEKIGLEADKRVAKAELDKQSLAVKYEKDLAALRGEYEARYQSLMATPVMSDGATY